MLDAKEAHWMATKLDKSFATIILEIKGDNIVLVARDHTRWHRRGAKCPHIQKVLCKGAWHRIVEREGNLYLSGGDLKDFVYYDEILYCQSCEAVIERIQARPLGA